MKARLERASLRLCLAGVGSLTIHLLMILLLVNNDKGYGEGEGGAVAGRGGLQVYLSRQYVEVKPSSEVSLGPLFGGRASGDGRGGEANSGLAADGGYEPPEIVSDIPFSLPESKVSGFMVARLEIDEKGRVVSAVAVYSNMPAEVTEQLLFRFSQARFRPARNAGKAIVDDILLQINLD